MHPHEALVRRFYACLAARDPEGAAACYHADVFFSDPLFPRLRGEAAVDLWRMRLESETTGAVRLLEVSADAEAAIARWSLQEDFRGRTVVTHGRAMFAFRGDRISRHYDHFSLWRWTSRAFGPAGAALGWFGPFRWAVRRRAARALERFQCR
ncbi:MAG TPA: nuclear transport factor 2 family protein [Usitatibacter sp.]|nr:nuclear transport factor 2 family protein [Usitatibacter sp.]